MSGDSPTQTYFTRQVHQLVNKVYARSGQQDSILEQAIDFFEQSEFHATHNVLTDELLKRQKLECKVRYTNLHQICMEIIALSEGENFSDSNRKSAQFLGTIQLLSPVEGKKVSKNNELCKPIYKAILCLRLLDRLILDDTLSDDYVRPHIKRLTVEQYQEFAKYDSTAYQNFVNLVKVPIVMAALLQDIGTYHPKVQSVFHEKAMIKNPRKVLGIEERKHLLQINYRETINYLTEGIGLPEFIGNTKAEREQFNLDEQAKVMFTKRLLRLSFNPKNSIGNLLKVPQIYTSIIMSTKNNYDYKLLPKAYQVLNKNAELGACSQSAVDALYQITGMFPQGYGIVYFPIGEYGEQSDCYEYAIVNAFYPKKPEQPICRMATRKLTFIGYGQNVVVAKQCNLYFPQTAKKLAALSKERLNEILALLSSNYQERLKLDLLPRCWFANEYFSVKNNQKLWTRVE